MKPLLVLGLLCLVGMASAASALSLDASESAGKRLYREGLSASGEPVMARVGAAGILLPATRLPCASCHGADGRGRPEGGVRPVDLGWSRLSSVHGQQQVNGRSYPAYSEASLARAIQEGRDPAGNRLDPSMPRFVLSLNDQRNLSAYLKRLAEDSDPGLETDSVHLGTLLPGTGPLAEEGATVAALLKGCIARINQAGGIHGRQLRLTIVDPGPDLSSAGQALDRLLDEEQVFALVAPLAPALGPALTQRLEQAGVPLIGAVSLFGAAPSSRQVFEPLPGLREQLFALADYAGQQLAAQPGPTLIAYPNEAGQVLAAEQLGQYLRATGWQDVRLQPWDPAQAPALPPLRSIFFLGNGAGFSSLASRLQAAGQAPQLLAIANQVAGDLLQVPEEFSRRVFLAYPFVPGDWTTAGRQALAQVREATGLGGQHALLQVAAFSSMLLLDEGLKQAGRDVSRERLVTALEGLHDFATGLTPPISFGPGRRLGLNGAHVVTLELPEQRFYLVAPYRPIAAMP